MLSCSAADHGFRWEAILVDYEMPLTTCTLPGEDIRCWWLASSQDAIYQYGKCCPSTIMSSELPMPWYFLQTGARVQSWQSWLMTVVLSCS
jgi:hypothetical protein